jgi:hypothetical protein
MGDGQMGGIHARARQLRCRRTLLLSFLGLLAAGGFGTASTTVQAVESIVVIVLDDSGSMNEPMLDSGRRKPRMEVAKDALGKVIDGFPDDTRLGLVLLNGASLNGGWLIPLGPLDKKNAIAQVQRLTARGGTPLGRAMKLAVEELVDHRRRQPYGDYRLLVVTDGEATDRSVLERYLPSMLARGIAVDVIGVDMQSDHTLASTAHSYRRANDAAGLQRALSEIFAESSDGGQDQAGDSDFDLLAGLPDGFVQQVLPALSEMKSLAVETSERSVASPPPVATTGSQPDGALASPRSWLNTRFFLFFFALFVIIQWIIAWQNKRGKK